MFSTLDVLLDLYEQQFPKPPGGKRIKACWELPETPSSYVPPVPRAEEDSPERSRAIDEILARHAH